MRESALATAYPLLREDYPHLAPEDIRAAIAYSSASVAHQDVVLLSVRFSNTA